MIIFSGMKIHISDTSSGSPISYENVSTVRKYTIPEDKYNEREGNLILYFGCSFSRKLYLLFALKL